MGNGPIETVLVDFGGTLFPNDLPLTPSVQQGRARALSHVLECDQASAVTMVDMIDAGIAGRDDDGPDIVIAEVLAQHGFEPDGRRDRFARQALCVPLAGVLSPFEHAGELLAGIKELPSRCVLLSNTSFRDAEMYRRDFEALGWAGWLDGYVTSVDARCAKPDERIFDMALEVAGGQPGSCVMVGNSEFADIAPAVRLGMRAVLVAIETPAPATTTATACVTGLDQALGLLRQWNTG